MGSCGRCYGSGKVSCPSCSGKGYHPRYNSNDNSFEMDTCLLCCGKKNVDCERCNGTGKDED